jgi:purine-nucleoside phosphorylase
VKIRATRTLHRVTQLDDPEAAARTAADALRRATSTDNHEIAIVLGSGWRPAADVIGEARAEVAIADLPGFAPPSVAGHGGSVRSVEVNGRRVLIMLGRTHGYEGHGVAKVVHGVRTAIASGARVVVLTNAAGGLRDGMQVGDPVLISDHLNLTGRTPLRGAHFLDLTDLYSPRLRKLARQIDPSLTEGVYAGLGGPQFETPAEIRMLRTLGADLVGMSTVLEAIAARAGEAEVVGLSLVTNLAAGITGEPLDHAEVLAAGQAAATRMGALLRELVSQA